MTVNAGAKLGRYEIRSKIGEGGMGEVYRARDEKLNRDVAIKVLPANLSQNGDRLRRFEQEAQATGALNHPNILAVYDVGTHDSELFVVSELLEGESLKDRLLEGRISQNKAVNYAVQIAHGLAAAHEKGIVHRDIKPDNLFITKDDHVKILDFGLAKLALPAADDVPQTDVATRKVHTDPGAVMGTPGYMSPEQVRGRTVDHRSDIFSFGAVLYEMLSGHRAFKGDSAIETLNAILKEDPAELSGSNSHVSTPVERVIWHCLEKSPERRFQSARDVAFALESLSTVTSHPSQQTITAGPSLRSEETWTRERLMWLGTCVLLILLTSAFAYAYFSRSKNNAHAVRLTLANPEATLPARVTVSPDGQRVVFIASDAQGKRGLWIRSLDSLIAQPLPSTDDANSPFWSPDSRYIGYFANGKIFKIDAAGGRPQTICDATDDGGGAWNRDGVILFGGSRGLMKVDAQGGTPTLATKIDAREEAHRWPSFLPDGRHFVFLADAETTEDHHIRVGSLDSQESVILLGAVSRIQYVSPGYLVYVSQGALVAQTFDAEKLKVTGEPMTIGEHIRDVGANHAFDFSVSENGVLAYQSGTPKSELTWFDRTGKKIGLLGEADAYAAIALSPDGQRVAAGMFDSDGRLSDIWVFDVTRTGSKSRLTFDPQSDGDPIWSPDGTRIVFDSNRAGDGHTHLYVTSASGTGDGQRLSSSNADSDSFATSWSQDGKMIFITHFSGNPHGGVWLVPVSGDHEAKPLLQSPEVDQTQASLSPDGHFIAYSSNESGRPQIYVRNFPLAERKWMISSDGGAYPLWSHDGKELFYITIDGKLMSAEIKTGAAFDVGVPRQLLQTRIKLNSDTCPYDVTPDGSRFIIKVETEANNLAPMTIALNWTSDLKR